MALLVNTKGHTTLLPKPLELPFLPNNCYVSTHHSNFSPSLHLGTLYSFIPPAVVILNQKNLQKISETKQDFLVKESHKNREKFILEKSGDRGQGRTYKFLEQCLADR